MSNVIYKTKINTLKNNLDKKYKKRTLDEES